MQNYQKYGKIWKETIAGNTRVHLCDPELVQTMYSYDGKVPQTPPLLETAKMYRKYRNISPGLGNVCVVPHAWIK
jgi:cytochrome P450 family 49 subfamily A